MIQVLVVEDEPASRDILIKYVSDCPGLHLAGVCENAMQAIDFLNQHQVDLLLLDIQMPGLSGIEFFKSLNNPPAVIFTTAYSEYAVEGFELNAVDYLLKPFPFERFLKAISKLRTKLSETPEAEAAFIMVKSDKVLHKVHFNEIIYVEACGDYLKIVRNEKNLLVHDTMINFHARLITKDFVRIHKSYVLNVNFLQQVEGNQVVLKDGVKLPIGKSYKTAFLELLH